jgi:acyl transferase domain-containing protein
VSETTALEHGQAIAIVGMSGRFPGAANVRQFWENLCSGVESISFIPREELIKAGYPEALVRDPAYVPAKAVLDDIDLFDAGFFGCSPREAELMDPQHRLFLECGWSALEDAGYDPGRYDGAIGVFAGVGLNSYLLHHIGTAPEVAMVMGWDKDYLATRLSYKLNLRGPSLTIQTACSTSLVAVAQACQSLLNFQCDLVLAGGAAISVPARSGYRYVEGSIMSPDGHCRAFDARAKGTVSGNGVAIVVLKRLEEAVRDRDAICAVIRGFAVNNDGAAKVGYAAPSVDGQAQVVAMAQALAGVTPDSISYIEAHGTGTELGDPIEIAALTQAFRAGTSRNGFCAIGSAKTNIGHLDAAAGVTGLIKTAVALRERRLPPSLHFEASNPKIDFPSSPFYVNTALQEWNSDGPRRAGVSSFGIGGTNAHVVLEEAPAPEPSSPSRAWQVLPVSARSADALGKATEALAAHLRECSSISLPDVAYTLQTGRKAFPVRRAVVCRAGEAAAELRLSADRPRTVDSGRPVSDASVAFLFPGQGTQYPGMVRDLHADEPVFREAVDECAAALQPIIGWDLKRVLCARADDTEAARLLSGTRATQLALFVTEYALARLWMSWGVQPQALAGHSIGEYVAACISGVFELGDALSVVAERGRLMEASTGGAMLAVTTGTDSLQPYLGDGVWLAAVNAPDVSVASGTEASVTALEARLQDAGIGVQRLNTSGAFHSGMMTDAAFAFRAVVERVTLRKPRIPFLSNVTGTWIRDSEAIDPEYWQRHLVSTVRFDGAAAALRESGAGVLLEVGPGRTLGTLIRQQDASVAGSAEAPIATLVSAHERRTSTESVALALARLWVRGAAIDWNAYTAAEQRARVPLPTYPFERQRYWLGRSMFQRPAVQATGKPGRTADVAKWFYAPVWTRRAAVAVAAVPADAATGRDWLIFADDRGVASAIAAAAASRGEQVTLVAQGERFEQNGADRFTVAPGARDDYRQLLEALAVTGRWPSHVAHCWGVGADDADPRAPIDPERDHRNVLHSIRLLTQGLADSGQAGEVRLSVVTTGVHDVTGLEPLSPGKASVLGLCRVLTQEHPHIVCGHVDVDADPSGQAADQIYGDIAAGPDTVVAYRRGQRWVQSFTQIDLPPARLPGRLRPGGVYVITGGLGRIAATMAEYLARSVQARIVLTSRSEFPPESQWDARGVEGGAVAARIQRLRRVQRAGGEVLVVQGDASSREQMARVLAMAQERFGAVHGVIHAAGWMTGDTFRGIVQTDETICAKHFGPKVDALLVLDDLTRGMPLDFCMLTSSLSVLLGGVGYGAYAAVNAFMDAFAARRNRTSGFPWIAVNWDGWATEELEAASGANPPAGFLLTGAEGAEAFGRILAGPVGAQVAISVGDLDARIRRWVRIHETADSVGGASTGAASAEEAKRHPRPALQNEYVAPRTEMEHAVAAIWREVLGFERIGVEDSFFELGGDSYLGIQVTARIKTRLGGNLSAVTLYESPTVAALAAVVAGAGSGAAARAADGRAAKRRGSDLVSTVVGTADRDGTDGDTNTEGTAKVNRTVSADVENVAVAVVGMAGRFPGAPTVDRFWQNLRDGVESRTVFSDDELLQAGVSRSGLTHPKLVRSGFVLDDIEQFDAGFFGINPREAEVLDPQHRLFLECAWEAIENAGYNSETFPGPVGVFGGATLSNYLLSNIYRNSELVRSIGARQAVFGSVPDYMVTRVAYKLNLRGPAIFVQSACSTSLVAVHLACRSLATGESDMALAGGVSVMVPHRGGYGYEEGGMMSPDGICRTFDANARGTVFGSGVGLVVLKRLADAIADGDTIHAVIRGAAMNNDGSLKVGFTAPGVTGQAQVVSDALAAAGVSADSISYVEAHGTGTELGDPIEIAALTRAYRRTTERNHFCAVGSVKPNIGHLDAAAGVSSLVKTIMALKHRQIPPTINYETPNAKIDFENSPFFVNTTLTPWTANGTPRRAGVSSFGFGGTNAHVIVEEAPALEPSGPSRPQQLLVLAARTESALEQATDRLGTALEGTQLPIADVAYTLAVGRRHFGHRRAVLCGDAAEAVDALQNRDPRRVYTALAEAKDREVVFMFPGQGSQYVRMGADLYRDEPVFRDAVDQCAQGLLEPLGADIRDSLYPAADEAAATDRLKQTAFTQASLFTVEYALARLWMSWGIRPAAMIGHSVGELVAACVAGVFSLDDALRLVAMRGRFMAEMAPGTMAAVPLPAERVTRLLGPGVSLAAVNAPSLCVVSGPAAAIDAFVEARAREGVECRKLHTSHAFHSAMMDDAVTRFTSEVAGVDRQAPSIRFISNVTGTWITDDEAMDPGYWSTHIRRPVAFSEGVATLLAQSDHLFLEVGPGNTLSALVRQQATGGHQIISSLRHPQERTSDVTTVLSALGRLWVNGAAVDWPAYFVAERRRRVALPSYPFERQRFWVDPEPFSMKKTMLRMGSMQQDDLSDWFHAVTWRRSPAPGPATADPARACLVFEGTSDPAVRLTDALATSSGRVLRVRTGGRFEKLADDLWTIRPDVRDDYTALFAAIAAAGAKPTVLVHSWGLTGQAEQAPDDAAIARMQSLGFFSLVAMTQALGSIAAGVPLRLAVVTDGVHEVVGGEPLVAERATVVGTCKVIPQEFANIACAHIDLAIGGDDASLDAVVAEILSGSRDNFVAYRNGRRWTQTCEALRLEAVPAGVPDRLHEGGTYLITGGFGGIGLVLAEHLAETYKARLVLTGRRPMPPRETWDEVLAGADESTRKRVEAVKKLESLGAEVLTGTADVTDEPRMRGVVAEAIARFGRIDGVIHSAGVAGGGVIQLKKPEVAGAVLAPKVNGTRILARLFKDQPLDFMLLCSSMASLVGGVGQVDYTAANACLDAFARQYAAATGTFTVAVNWNAWREVGMAVDTNVPEDLRDALKGAMMSSGISNREGVEAFRRILALSTESQVAISPNDLSVLAAAVMMPDDRQMSAGQIPAGDKGAAARTQQTAAAAKATGHPRPALPNPFIAPRTDAEKRVCAVWQELLGIDSVGVDDNFFELGGHSLLAIRVMACVNDALGTDMPVARLYDGLTVRSLAEANHPGRAAETAAVEEQDEDDRRRDRVRRQREQLARRRGGMKEEVSST